MIGHGSLDTLMLKIYELELGLSLIIGPIFVGLFLWKEDYRYVIGTIVFCVMMLSTMGLKFVFHVLGV